MESCVFSLPISHVMIKRLYTVSYYHHQIDRRNLYPLLGLGHETMVCAVCLSIFMVTWYIHFLFLQQFWYNRSGNTTTRNVMYTWRCDWYGPLNRDAKLRVAHAPEMPGAFSPPPRVSDPDMRHGACMTHVPWCMPWSLTRGFLWSWWRGKLLPSFPAHAQPVILRIL